MKNILISFLALILFVSCQTTAGVIQEDLKKPVTVIIVPDAAEPKTKVEPESKVEPEVESNVYAGLVLPNGVSTRDTERGKVLVSDKKIIFEFRKANLPEDASYVLNDVVKYILDNNPNVRIVLEAHTSNKGVSYPYNYSLSLQRSAVGEKYLSELGVTSERLMTKSYGESLPEYPEQKDLRRYEFVVIENEDDLIRYNKFFSTINAQADMTYNIYVKRVKAYEERNSSVPSEDENNNNNTAVFNNDETKTKVMPDNKNTDTAKEVFTPNKNDEFRESDKANTNDEEFDDESMFIEDSAKIIN